MRVRQIQRADRTDTGLVEHVGIDHDGRYVRVSKQFLHGANIRVCFRQVRCETVTQAMASQPLVDTACVCRALDGLLQRTLMQVMSAKCAAARISGEATCRKQELPLQFTARIRILARLQITKFLGRQLACHCRMGNLEFPGGVEPVTPVDIACGRLSQQVAIGNPYCIDALAKLPSRQAILAACHLEIAVDPGRGKGLDLVILLGLNELLDAFHMPAPLLPGYGSFMGAFQVVVKKARSGVMDDGGGV